MGREWLEIMRVFGGSGGDVRVCERRAKERKKQKGPGGMKRKIKGY